MREHDQCLILMRQKTLHGLLFAIILSGIIGLAGCSRTYTGGYSDSPSGYYRIYGKVLGALGRRFIDHTTKTVRITIVRTGTNEIVVFTKEYKVVGDDVSWDDKWVGDTALTLLIFDYGPGVSYYDKTNHVLSTNYLRTVALRIDPKTSNFVEQVVN
jgi:hypothetical protein